MHDEVTFRCAGAMPVTDTPGGKEDNWMMLEGNQEGGRGVGNQTLQGGHCTSVTWK